jgi:hypothetical protein
MAERLGLDRGPLGPAHLCLQGGPLLYAVLARTANQRSEVDKRVFLSQFHTSLKTAIQKDNITESLLFGLCFAVLSNDADHEVPLERMSAVKTYIEGFVAVAEHLDRNRDDRELRLSLTGFWKHALRELWMYYDEFTLLTSETPAICFKLFALYRKLSGDDCSDSRLTELSSWLSGARNTRPPWKPLYREIGITALSLQALFGFLVQKPHTVEAWDIEGLLLEPLSSIRTQVDEYNTHFGIESYTSLVCHFQEPG